MNAFRRVTASVALGLALLAANACSGEGDGDGPTKAEIAAKIRQDPRMADSPPAVVDCLADWYMNATGPDERKAFVDNQPGDTPAPRPPDDTLLECLKKAV